MRNKISIYFKSDNQKHSQEIYNYIDDLLKTHIIDKSILKNISTELNINYKF